MTAETWPPWLVAALVCFVVLVGGLVIAYGFKTGRINIAVTVKIALAFTLATLVGGIWLYRYLTS